MTSWWERASTELRLAQIDGGIECGMNAPQIAMNCGTGFNTLTKFAHYHSCNFGGRSAGRIGANGLRRKSEMMSCVGHKRNAAMYGSFPDTAFSIFGNAPQDEILSWGER